VKLVGPPGSAALMTAPDAEPGYLGIAPPGFTNEVAARIALHIPTYRPGRSAAKVRCPILFCICEHDSVAPAGSALKAARKAPNAEVRTYPIGHFDIYVDGGFERAVADQTEFLVRHLLG
jgi:pimeloyl-ACP methyl ester carboxylesterase